MSTTLDRAPGWDAQVRTRAATCFGNLYNFLRYLDLTSPTDEHPMMRWSRIVVHLDSTANVERLLDELLADDWDQVVVCPNCQDRDDLLSAQVTAGDLRLTCAQCGYAEERTDVGPHTANWVEPEADDCV